MRDDGGRKGGGGDCAGGLLGLCWWGYGALLYAFVWRTSTGCDFIFKKNAARCSFFCLFYVLIYVRTTDPFDSLLHRYRGLLFTMCRHHSRHDATMDDLLQEASVALWRDRERLLSLPAVQQAALVWKIALNAVIDTLRRTKETDSLPDDYDAPADDRTLVNELHERISLLDEPDRTIVRMQLEGYSYEEIGAEMGMTEKNVSVRLVRIKEKIRKEWI